MKKLSLFLVALTMILFSCKPEVEKPTVVTKSVGDVTKTSAKVVGQVTADGGADVTERGVCWSTDGTPTILDYRVKDVEGGLGIYDVVFTDLVPNTQYYVRAYATNEAGTGYGDEKTFVTVDPEDPEGPEGPENPENPENPEQPEDPEQPENPEDPENPENPEQPEQPENPENPEEPEVPEQPEEGAPVVTTAEVTNITLNSATCGGEVTFDGNVTVTARGICWGTSPNPTIEDNRTSNGSGVGIFTSNLSDLESNTTYYVRAYATNEVGTAYGEEKIFTTLPIEGTTNGHAWVDLGLPSGKKWATCNVGAAYLEEYGDYFAWGETSTKSDYSSSNCSTYGLSISQLQSQGYIDSEGNLNPQYDAATANWGGTWRMPTKAEQEELLNSCTWTWTTQNGVNGYNVEGPSGASIFLPAAGNRYGSSLYDAGDYGYYWSSTPLESDYAYYLSFNSSKHNVSNYNRSFGQSVRPVLE